VTYFAVALLGAVCLANLLLLLAVARRVRHQDEQLASQARLRPLPVLKAGNLAPDFTVTTVTGQTRSLSDLTDIGGVLAFLTPDCSGCLARVPDLKDYAQAHPSGRTHVVAVVCGAQEEGAKLARELQESMSVVIEPLNGPAQQAYSVSEYPLFYVIRADGRITARGASIEAYEGAHLRVDGPVIARPAVAPR
jgi:peroxiredoxin